MTRKLPGMTLNPIGVVRNAIKLPPGPGYSWRDVTSEIVIDVEWAEALDGLEEFSHIIILWWMHQPTLDNVPIKIHPMGKKELPLVGVLPRAHLTDPTPSERARSGCSGARATY